MLQRSIYTARNNQTSQPKLKQTNNLGHQLALFCAIQSAVYPAFDTDKNQYVQPNMHTNAHYFMN